MPSPTSWRCRIVPGLVQFFFCFCFFLAGYSTWHAAELTLQKKKANKLSSLASSDQFSAKTRRRFRFQLRLAGYRAVRNKLTLNLKSYYCSSYSFSVFGSHLCCVLLLCWVRVQIKCSSATVLSAREHRAGRPVMSDVSLLSGISGLPFHSTFLSPVLFFCLLLLLFPPCLYSFSCKWSILPTGFFFFSTKCSVFFVKQYIRVCFVWLLFSG